MARNRNHRRDPIAIARPVLGLPSVYDPVSQLINDMRLFNPDPIPVVSFNVQDRRLVAGPTMKSRPAFFAPDNIMLCARRHRRREVMFAIGRSGGGNRRGKRNAYSGISCRRS